MMPENAGLVIWTGIKLIVLLGLGIYIIFAGVIVRQEQLMSKVLEADSEKVLAALSWVHFGAAAVVFILALLIL